MFFPNGMRCASLAAADLQQVKLNPALHVDRLVLSAPHLLALEVQLTQNRFDASNSAQVGEEIHLHTNQQNSFCDVNVLGGKKIKSCYSRFVFDKP